MKARKLTPKRVAELDNIALAIELDERVRKYARLQRRALAVSAEASILFREMTARLRALPLVAQSIAQHRAKR